MAINFPDSPTTGQIFTSGSTSWIYDGVKWGLNTNVAVSNDSMPVGSILWYANTSTAPPGWIAADGSAVSRTTYATLFGIIGTTYGSGDGSTTFNVPSVAATTGKYYIRYTTSLGTVTTTSLSTAPVGTMLDWPTTSSYPTGYLRADGSAVSRTSYADLFALIGTTYGSGDGSTTFNLPNIVAAGTGSPVSIIKASLGGTVEPSTVAHASSHAAGGSDPVLLKQSQISDFIFTTEAARDAAITSPVKGMRAYITAPTIPTNTSGAQTVYNGSVWVCITPQGSANITTQDSTTNTSYVDLTTSGPTATLVTGTSALVSISAQVYGPSGQPGWASVAVSGATTISASDANGIRASEQSSLSVYVSASRTFILTGLTAGTNTFTMKYKSAVGNATYFNNRSIVVTGIV